MLLLIQVLQHWRDSHIYEVHSLGNRDHLRKSNALGGVSKVIHSEPREHLKAGYPGYVDNRIDGLTIEGREPLQEPPHYVFVLTDAESST